MGAIIPALMHRIPSELRSETCLGESSTRMGNLLGSPRVLFLLRDERAITVDVVFCECENNGKRKGVIGNNKTRNRGLDCEFLSFGAFEVSVAGQFA